jgi:glycosyltransferase involved in cell wall biosynthesis
MNIVYVAPFGLGQKTTVWARTLPMAKQVVAIGHRATIVVPPWDTPEDSNTRSEHGGVRIVQVETSGGLPLIWQRLLREVHQLQPDIVHVVKPRAYAGLVQWWQWQRRKTGWRRFPALLLDIDDWEQAWGPINGYSMPTSRFLNWQEEWGIRHTDGITAASRWLVERAQAYAPETPTLYLPNGVSPPAMPANNLETAQGTTSKVDGHQVLFFTRFVEISPDWLAQFWRSLLDLAPDCKLTVAGNALQPGRETAYQQAMTALGKDAETRVAWLGYVDQATIDQLYSESDCAIFPAQEEPLQQAKCSVRLATTLLNGVPVVASAVGEQAAYGADGAAELINADATPEMFACAVHALLCDRSRQEAMVRSARQHLAEQYDWSRLGQNLVEFYGQFADKRA